MPVYLTVLNLVKEIGTDAKCLYGSKSGYKPLLLRIERSFFISYTTKTRCWQAQVTSTYKCPRLPKSGGNKKNYTVVKESLKEQIIVGWAGRKSNPQDIPGDAETVQHLSGLSWTAGEGRLGSDRLCCKSILWRLPLRCTFGAGLWKTQSVSVKNILIMTSSSDSSINSAITQWSRFNI